ncbi:hypothetical protein PENSPDRAFT_651652 [Peniophora sp. CONT]|nr:hypothetical protein PENSPDRAFT_651652 [Peniophora sp. CONT]
MRAVPALISCIFFGMFSLLFAGSSLQLVKRGLSQRSNAAMLLITTGMYCASALYLSMDMHSYLSALAHPEWILSSRERSAVHQATTLTVAIGWNFMFSDLIVLWRACSLWKERKFVRWVSIGIWVIAFVLAIGDIATSVQRPEKILVDSTVTIGGVSFLVPQPTMDRWGQICIFISFLANLWVTVLYAVKTWKFRKLARSRVYADDPETQLLYEILVILLYFSIAYCIFWLVFITISITDTGDMSGSEEHLALDGAIAQITGIYPTAIVVLVGWHQRRAEEAAEEGRLPSRARSSRPLDQLDSVVLSDPSSDEVDRSPRTAASHRAFLEEGGEYGDVKEPVDAALGSESATMRNDSDLSKSSESRRASGTL